MGANNTDNPADLSAEAEWEGTQDVRFQIDGNDLISIRDIDYETGEATVIVYAGTRADAPILFSGTVNVLSHLPPHH